MTTSTSSRPQRPLPPPLRERLEQGRFDYHHSDAVSQNVNPAQVTRWVRKGYLTPLERGDYVISAPFENTDQFARTREKHLRHCASVVHGHSGLYLVGRSALCAYGLPLLHIPSHVEVSCHHRTRSNRPAILTHMPWGLGATATPADIPSQSCADAIIQCAALHGIREGLVAADAALHVGVSPQELQQSLTHYGHRRGVGTARYVAELADGRIESPGESLLRLELHRAGLDAEPQVVLTSSTGAFVARVDFLITGSGVVIEFDGMLKYTEPAVLRDEKLGQMAIEELGYTVLRFAYRDLSRPEHIVSTILRALSRATDDARRR